MCWPFFDGDESFVDRLGFNALQRGRVCRPFLGGDESFVDRATRLHRYYSTGVHGLDGGIDVCRRTWQSR